MTENETGATIHELPERAEGTDKAGGLSARQKLLLNTIIEHVETHGYPPSVRDLQGASGLASSSSVAYQLLELEKRGFIRKQSGLARGMEILKRADGSPLDLASSPVAAPAIDDERQTTIPLLGEIAAGTGLLAEQNVESSMSLPRELTGFGDLFMLKVRGDSMINAGIFDGDLVVVRQQATANNGDMVAALINGDEATVKTYKKSGNQIWLMPHNPDFAPIDGNDCSVMGIVVTVLRKV
ncbi:MAG: LexA repressor [Actinomycetota bacterium]